MDFGMTIISMQTRYSVTKRGWRMASLGRIYSEKLKLAKNNDQSRLSRLVSLHAKLLII